jgi:hypothetical protein
MIIPHTELTAAKPDVIFQLFDRFGDLNCESEMARLDNFALQLQSEPDRIGVLIFYGGRRFRSRLPKRGEAAARAARLKPYLVGRRGLPADTVFVLDGGYRDEWRLDLWIAPRGRMPAPDPTIPTEKIKFHKGRVRARDYRCHI